MGDCLFAFLDKEAFGERTDIAGLAQTSENLSQSASVDAQTISDLMFKKGIIERLVLKLTVYVGPLVVFGRISKISHTGMGGIQFLLNCTDFSNQGIKAAIHWVFTHM